MGVLRHLLGQRTVYTASTAHAQLVPTTCRACLGVGERMAGGDHMAARTS